MSSAVVAESGHTGSGPEGPSVFRTLLKYPDFLVLAAALPVFIAAEWPIAAWVTTAVAWVGLTVLIGTMEYRAEHATEPKTQVGLVVGGALARAWISAAVILATGLIFGDPAGLACALLMILLFTIYFVNKMFIHFITPARKA
jgi:hypothetical protein